MNTTDRLVHMVNQIAVNLATDPDPVGAIAQHIQIFWDPRMKQMIKAHDGTGLLPDAASAINQLNAMPQNG